MPDKDWDKPTNDWGTPIDNEQSSRSTPSFKEDLGGLLFHLSMVVLIGSAAVIAWQLFMPQPTIQIEIKENPK